MWTGDGVKTVPMVREAIEQAMVWWERWMSHYFTTGRMTRKSR